MKYNELVCPWLPSTLVSDDGCRILRDAADRLERLTGDPGSQKVMEYRDGS